MRPILLLLTFLICPAMAQTLPPQVAIIIDDIGYQKVDPDIIRLPYPLTLAVMPFTPHGTAMLTLAKQHRKELMLHMPMEAVAQNHLLGPGALRRQMSKQQIQQHLHAALADVPGIVGINNHMGSLLTSLAPQMDWVMEVVAAKQLYFIDSKTTGRSVAAQVAARYQVPQASRDIFLDNDKSYAALDKQFNQLVQHAKVHGSAIAIGHPYPETYRYLKKNLPRLAANGIQLVSVSTLLRSDNSLLARHAVPTKPDTMATAPASKPSTIQKANTAALVEPMPTVTVEQPDEMELLPWRPPYLPGLPEFTPPPANLDEPSWRRFLLPPAPPSVSSSHLPSPYLR